MKRILANLLSLVMLFSVVLPGTALATGEDAVFTLNAAEGRPGEIVDVVVTLKTTSAVNSIALTGIEYDESVLEFVGFADYDHLQTLMPIENFVDVAKKTIMAPLTKTAVFNGAFCTLQFKIKDTIEEDCTVKVNASSKVKASSTEFSSVVHSGTVKVSTYVPVTGISFDKNEITVGKGATVTLTPDVEPFNATDKTVTWKSSNTSVAKVSAGKITGVGVGSATITATTKDGGFTASCKVNVVIPVEAVSVDQDELVLEKGERAKLNATVLPADATNQNVIWSSSNEKVAKVSANGEVTAVASGDAVITATTEDGGKTATCDVKVIVAKYTMEDAEGRPGEIVKVNVFLKSLEDINSIALTVLEFDKTVLEFVGFADYDHLETVMPIESFVDVVNKTIMAPLKNTAKFDGKFCAFEFKIKEDAPECEVKVGASSVSKNGAVVLNSAVQPAVVTVRHQIPGDITGDDNVDIYDAVALFQYSMLPDMYPVEYSGSMDFNKDGVVDIYDAVLVFQHSMLPDMYPLG